MPNNAQPFSVSPESLERKHEASEKKVRNVLIIGGSAAFLLAVSLMICAMTIHFFAQTRPMQRMQSLGIISAPNLKPLERFPKPNLEIDDDHAQMTALLAQQNKKLNSYGWIDRSNGIVRIPIDRAMNLILQRGLPSMAVEEWVLRVRVSFCSAGIHGTSTVAAICSTRAINAGVTVNFG